MTGFTSFEYTMGGKWLETLNELAPRGHPDDSNGPGFQHAIERVAPSLEVQLASASVRDAADIESTIDALSRSENGGLIGLPTSVTPLPCR
jgi:putative ABC transport system substrate-binding protein